MEELVVKSITGCDYHIYRLDIVEVLRACERYYKTEFVGGYLQDAGIEASEDIVRRIGAELEERLWKNDGLDSEIAIVECETLEDIISEYGLRK